MPRFFRSRTFLLVHRSSSAGLDHIRHLRVLLASHEGAREIRLAIGFTEPLETGIQLFCARIGGETIIDSNAQVHSTAHKGRGGGLLPRAFPCHVGQGAGFLSGRKRYPHAALCNWRMRLELPPTSTPHLCNFAPRVHRGLTELLRPESQMLLLRTNAYSTWRSCDASIVVSRYGSLRGRPILLLSLFLRCSFKSSPYRSRDTISARKQRRKVKQRVCKLLSLRIFLDRNSITGGTFLLRTATKPSSVSHNTKRILLRAFNDTYGWWTPISLALSEPSNR